MESHMSLKHFQIIFIIFPIVTCVGAINRDSDVVHLESHKLTINRTLSWSKHFPSKSYMLLIDAHSLMYSKHVFHL
jgi:hypothetical protein